MVKYDSRPSTRPVRTATLRLLPLAMYDQLVAPIEWDWSDRDVKANQLLNRHSLDNPRTQAPSDVRKWRGERPRTPLEAAPGGVGWVPRYFPDDSSDFAFVLSKHVYVMKLQEARFAFLESMRSLCRVVAQSEFTALPDGQTAFSPFQFLRFHYWVADHVPTFATDPGLRDEIIHDWMISWFSRDPQRLEELTRLGPLLLFTDDTARLVLEQLMEE